MDFVEVDELVVFGLVDVDKVVSGLENVEYVNTGVVYLDDVVACLIEV